MMKKLLAISLSAFLLSACGGGDSESSGNYTSTFKKILANQNEYTCTTQTAFTACTDDTTCKSAGCSLTKQVSTPSNTNTTKVCEVTAGNVYGKNGESCRYTSATANAVLTCSNNTLFIDGKIGNLTASNSSFGQSFNDGVSKLKFSCKS